MRDMTLTELADQATESIRRSCQESGRPPSVLADVISLLREDGDLNHTQNAMTQDGWTHAQVHAVIASALAHEQAIAVAAGAIEVVSLAAKRRRGGALLGSGKRAGNKSEKRQAHARKIGREYWLKKRGAIPLASRADLPS